MAGTIDVSAEVSRRSIGGSLASGDESGTAPGDRPFRPDVEGLRAVAVLLVVLFHSGVSGVSGGYVGVDVFFVISGFVITGVLFRERNSTGRTSIIAFYGRRCRRIIPAATVVIIATVALAFLYLDIGSGIRTATDGRWAAVFLANFRFIATGTNYLASQEPPSPLQNFWSLAVEEQFYVVYPTLYLLVASAKAFPSGVRMAAGLVVIIVLSLSYSITNTPNNPVNAFFSPFTRAWELALGALVAFGTPWLLKVSNPAGHRCNLARPGCHCLRRRHIHLAVGLPRFTGHRPGRRCRADHRRRHAGTCVRSRGPLAPASLPVAWEALLLAVPVALADPDHRRRVCGQDDPLGQGRPGLGPLRPGAIRHHLFGD